MAYNKNTDWANEEEYLNGLIKNGNAGEKSWATTQLGILNKEKANYGNALTPTGTDGPKTTNAGGDIGGVKNILGPTVNSQGLGTNVSQSNADGDIGGVRSTNNDIDIPNNGTPTTGTYTPNGTHNDANLPAEALSLIQLYKKQYDEAMAKGDTAAAEEAHRLAEGVRALYGYSGGADGSEYIELGKTPTTGSGYTPSGNGGLGANDILGWNDKYNAKNPAPTYEELTIGGKGLTQAQLDLLEEYLSLEDFAYDVENDPLFAQYKTMYNREGDRAMRDTLAEAAASAGGMNSYAISAAQQANNYYASQLNDKIPELYQLAYEMYLQDKESKIQELGLISQMDDKQYSRFRDTMNDYWNNKSFDYGVYSDAVSQGNWEKNFNHSVSVDNRNFNASQQAAAKDEVWNLISLGVTPSADLIAKAGMSQTDIDLAVAAVKAGSNPNNNNNNGYNPDDNNNNNNNNNNNGYNPDDNNNNNNNNNNNGYNPDDNNNNNNNNNNPAATGNIDKIREKCATFTSNDALNDYLTRQHQSGNIDKKTMGELYIEFEIPSLANRNWSVDSDGGINWGWGIDNNASVIDQYENTYTLSKLVEALVAEGMDKNAAKEYVKSLQSKLGI